MRPSTCAATSRDGAWGRQVRPRQAGGVDQHGYRRRRRCHRPTPNPAGVRAGHHHGFAHRPAQSRVAFADHPGYRCRTHQQHRADRARRYPQPTARARVDVQTVQLDAPDWHGGAQHPRSASSGRCAARTRSRASSTSLPRGTASGSRRMARTAQSNGVTAVPISALS
jgi:hypothetical protein